MKNKSRIKDYINKLYRKVFKVKNNGCKYGITDCDVKEFGLCNQCNTDKKESHSIYIVIRCLMCGNEEYIFRDDLEFYTCNTCENKDREKAKIIGYE